MLVDDEFLCSKIELKMEGTSDVIECLQSIDNRVWKNLYKEECWRIIVIWRMRI